MSIHIAPYLTDTYRILKVSRYGVEVEVMGNIEAPRWNLLPRIYIPVYTLPGRPAGIIYVPYTVRVYVRLRSLALVCSWLGRSRTPRRPPAGGDHFRCNTM